MSLFKTFIDSFSVNSTEKKNEDKEARPNLSISSKSQPPSSSPTTSTIAASISNFSKDSDENSYKFSQFTKALKNENVDIKLLKKLAWNGIPSVYRPQVWQMLLGYMPIAKDRQQSTINRKRKEYLDSITTYFVDSSGDADRTTQDGETQRQIRVDMPRTCPDTPFFHQSQIRQAMERILYIWSIRHPASGYVQGMNDLVTPIFLICIQVSCFICIIGIILYYQF